MAGWNPWHGCRRISPGCLHCYVYRIDALHGKDASRVTKTRDFDLPLQRRRDGAWRLPAGERVYTCFSSDFFIEEADGWREEAWAMIRARTDARFLIPTKRIARFGVGLPPDWGAGYPHVGLYCTCEDDERARTRMPLFLDAPLHERLVLCEPLLGPLDLSPWLDARIQMVVVGGESGENARTCNYDWVLDIRRQCAAAGVAFAFKQTGARFIKDGRLYRIPRSLQHLQAAKAGIDLPGRSVPPH